MKTVIIAGFTNLESRCAKLIDILAQFLEQKESGEVEIIYPSKMDIHPCLGCEYCLAHQDQCIYRDDMQSIYQSIKEADILIFVSPVYFSNIPSTLKKVIDRCQLFYNLKDKSQIKEKAFMAIHVGGAPAYRSQFKAFEFTYDVLLPDFKAKLLSFHHFSNADQVNVLEDKKFIEEIKTSLEKIV